MVIQSSSPILVSKTRTGKNKYWQGHIAKQGSRWFTQTSYWQRNLDGSDSLIQFSDPYEVLPKNVDRSNATTAEEQARLELERMVTKQKDKGYTEEGETSKILPLPMLAQKFVERGDKLKGRMFVQAKLDGNRLLYNGEVGWSRGGKYVIPEVINHLRFDTGGLILDGELMLPGNKLLQESMTAIKKYRPGLSETLQYYVYDVVDEEKTFAERHEILKKLSERFPTNVILHETHEIFDLAEVYTYHQKWTSEGFEGTMVRDDSEGYDIGHRSNQLLKLKDFKDGEWPIIDVVEGDGRFKGLAIFVCRAESGKEFNCTPEGSTEIRQQYYRDRKRHIGKYLTIRYQTLSKEKVPIFPIGVGVRDGEDF